jgi:hypothetical protein
LVVRASCTTIPGVFTLLLQQPNWARYNFRWLHFLGGQLYMRTHTNHAILFAAAAISQLYFLCVPFGIIILRIHWRFRTATILLPLVIQCHFGGHTAVTTIHTQSFRNSYTSQKSSYKSESKRVGLGFSWNVTPSVCGGQKQQIFTGSASKKNFGFFKERVLFFQVSDWVRKRAKES